MVQKPETNGPVTSFDCEHVNDVYWETDDENKRDQIDQWGDEQKPSAISAGE